MKGSLFITGPAGTGKSTLAGSLKEWMQRQDIDSIIVKLDPGAEYIPYEADIDIREWISISQIMSEFNLGPNGAQIVASDMILENIDAIRTALENYDDYYVIFDTPGQIELFSFRPSSSLMVDALAGNQSMIAFVADSIISSTPSGFISQKLLFGSIMSRFLKPTMFILNKTDLVTSEDIKNIESWETSTDALNDAFVSERESSNKQYFVSVISAFRESGLMTKIHKVSSREMSGLEDIYSDMSLYFSGGADDDTLYRDD
jgi:hypothetical protein